MTLTMALLYSRASMHNTRTPETEAPKWNATVTCQKKLTFSKSRVKQALFIPHWGNSLVYTHLKKLCTLILIPIMLLCHIVKDLWSVVNWPHSNVSTSLTKQNILINLQCTSYSTTTSYFQLNTCKCIFLYVAVKEAWKPKKTVYPHKAF